ncbi:MAG: hypothetical protein ACRDZ5_06850 [Acidimicrobiales bacterium]
MAEDPGADGNAGICEVHGRGVQGDHQRPGAGREADQAVGLGRREDQHAPVQHCQANQGEETVRRAPGAAGRHAASAVPGHPYGPVEEEQATDGRRSKTKPGGWTH